MTTRHKKFISWFASLALLSLLAACGGADGDAARSLPFTSAAALRASAPPASLPGTESRSRPLGVTATIDVESLLNWAESSYPLLFPRGPATQRMRADGVNYTLRHYPATGNYVGMADDGSVWGYGPFTGNSLKSYGQMSDYTCLVSPRLCDQVPVVCKTEITTGFSGDLNATYIVPDNGGDGASGDGGGGSAGAGGSEGKVLGGRIKVIRLSDGVELGEGVTDSTLGLTTIKWCKQDMPVMLELRGAPGAKYFDEAVNDLVDFPITQKLRALVDKFDENVGVSALTEAAYLYAMNNIVSDPKAIASGTKALVTDGVPVGMSREQVQRVNSLVLAEVNRLFTDRLQQASVKSLATPIDQASGSNALPGNRYGRLAALTGGFARIAGTYAQTAAFPQTSAARPLSATAGDVKPAAVIASPTTPALLFSRQFSQDFTDGRINGFDLGGREVATLTARTFNVGKVSENWTLGEGLMSARFGVNSTFIGTEDYIATTTASGYLPGCESEKYSGTYYLGKSGEVAEVWKSPGICQSNGVGFYTFDRQFLTRVRSLSDFHISNSAFAIMLDGSLSTWGSNNCGALGVSRQNGEYVRNPLKVPGLQNIVQVTAVGGAIFALTAAGDVYAWGQNYENIFDFMVQSFDGVCEVDGVRSGYFSKPRKVERLSGIKFLSGGGYVGLIAVGAGGNITVVARTIYAKLNGQSIQVLGIYTLPQMLPDAVKVEPLAYATIALNRDGKVMAWENGLGHPIDAFYVWENIGIDSPLPLRGIENIVDITTDARNNLLISLDTLGSILLHSGPCRNTEDMPPFPYNYISLGGKAVSAATFPVIKNGLRINIPRGVRLTRINDSVAFVGADGVTYALSIGAECSKWAWVAVTDAKLSEFSANGGVPIAIPQSIVSADCSKRPSDYICQEFNGSALPYSWTDTKGELEFVVEKFTPSDTSDALRITESFFKDTYMEYRLLPNFPRSGTIEMRVFVESARIRTRYPSGSGGSYGTECAPLLLSDWGDVRWPGSTWFYGCPDGAVELVMATKNSPAVQAIRAEGTSFRFRKWVRIGFSYGTFGQSISIDGRVVASSADNTQELGSGGNEIQPRNKINLGFYRSDVPGRAEGGFEGAVDWFRVSRFPNDWVR